MDCFAEPVVGRAFGDPLARNDGSTTELPWELPWLFEN
jgi:hypothetical protein